MSVPSEQYQRVRQRVKDSDGGTDDDDFSSLIVNATASRHSEDDGSNDESFETADDGLNQRSNSFHGSPKGGSIQSSLSFDFDDDDDDEEDLQRYRFEAAEGLSTASPSVPQLSAWPPSSAFALVAWLPHLWRAYCDMRLERRQQRAQQLLNAHTKQQRFRLRVSSWCDLCDRGWSVWLAIVLIWILLCRFYSEERSVLVGIGVPFLLLRFLWQPLFVSVLRRSQPSRQSSLDPIAKPSDGGMDRWERPAYRDRQETTVELANTYDNPSSDDADSRTAPSIQIV